MFTEYFDSQKRFRSSQNVQKRCVFTRPSWMKMMGIPIIPRSDSGAGSAPALSMSVLVAGRAVLGQSRAANGQHLPGGMHNAGRGEVANQLHWGGVKQLVPGPAALGIGSKAGSARREGGALNRYFTTCFYSMQRDEPLHSTNNYQINSHITSLLK